MSISRREAAKQTNIDAQRNKANNETWRWEQQTKAAAVGVGGAGSGTRLIFQRTDDPSSERNSEKVNINKASVKFHVYGEANCAKASSPGSSTSTQTSASAEASSSCELFVEM